MATRFDSISGELTQIDLRGTSRQYITKKWAMGVFTQLGIAVQRFPNIFFVYRPQAPTAFATGLISAKVQVSWIMDYISYLDQHSFSTIEATEEAEKKWKEHINVDGAKGLFADGHSWWYSENIPGKPQEALNYMAGMPAYKKWCAESAT
jgi:cation diffusion facilitator CzcD-associated flavoprotein CzcO